MKDITKKLKHKRFSATPISLPFIVTRRVPVVPILWEAEPVDVDDLINEAVERAGLQGKCNTYAKSKIRIDAYLRDGNNATFDPDRVHEIYAVQLYNKKK